MFCFILFYRKCFLSDECLQIKKDFIKEINRNTGLGNLQELIEKYYR